MHLDNIIIASDLSEHCGAAAKWAQHFKQRVGAKHLFVEHVIELSVASWLGSAFEVLEDDEQRGVAESQVAEWFTEHTGAQPDGVILRAGNCLAHITEVVENLEGNTLLVVSMSGKGAFTRFFLGSTAHALASKPPCAVAVVHPDHLELGTEVPIVTATDLSRNGRHAVAFAAGVARAGDVPLEIVHAYGAPTSPLVNLTHALDQTTVTKTVTRKIERLRSLGDVDSRIRVLYEDPAEAIVEHARSLDSDLIVLGHTGETLFAQSVLGSVAQVVLNHMPCTVIVVPPPLYSEDGSDDEEE